VSKSPLYVEANNFILSNEQATKETILRELDRIIGTARSGDTIVVFFSGHGMYDPNNRNKLFIGLSSTDMSDMPGTSLAFEAIADRLKTAKARVVVLLDICHGGLADRARIATNDDAVTQLVTQTGSSMIVIAASKGRQDSEETEGQKGGRFSIALDRILTRDRKAYDLDKSGGISLSELYRGLKSEVVKGSNGRQTPGFRGI
jgi:uncharacterized caspase-like protein